MADREFRVDVQWDDQASVLVATSKDIPGLVIEADTMPLLKHKIADVGPALLEAQGIEYTGGYARLYFHEESGAEVEFEHAAA